MTYIFLLSCFKYLKHEIDDIIISGIKKVYLCLLELKFIAKSVKLKYHPKR